MAGDAGLCARFEAVRRRVLCAAVHRDTLRADVAEMRLRMRRELSECRAGKFDIKQDAGGIADIEFLVQYWVLELGRRASRSSSTYSDNVRQLEGLAAAGLVEPRNGALAQGNLYRLSYAPASPVAGRRAAGGGGRGARAATRPRSRRSGARLSADRPARLQYEDGQRR